MKAYRQKLKNSGISIELAARVQEYRCALLARLERAAEGRTGLVLHRREGLRLRIPGTIFHSTPEVFLVEVGRNRIVCPEGARTVGAGQSTLIAPGLPHGETFLPGPEQFRMIVAMYLGPGFTLHAAGTGGGSRPPPQVDPFEDGRALRLRRHLEDIEAALAEGLSPTSEYIRGCWIAWLDLTLRCLDSAGTPEPRSPNPLVARALERIEVDLANLELGAASLARRLGCSADHLSRMVRRWTGRTLMRQILDRRLNHARRLLELGELNVAETAWASGFAHPSYFNRVFRQAEGCTPRAYRARFRGGAVSRSRRSR